MTIEKRVEMLERELTRAKRRQIVITAVAMILAVVCLGPALSPIYTNTAVAQQANDGEKIIRANRFVVVDKNGNDRITLAMEVLRPSDELRSALLSADPPDPSAVLGVLKARPILRLYDEAGETRAALAAHNEGSGLAVFDENGNLRTQLGTNSEVNGLAVYDETGQARAELLSSEEGPKLRLSDENGKNRVALFASSEGTALFFSDENDKLRAALGAFEEGPELSFIDQKGNIRAVLGVSQTETPDGKTITYPESSLLLFGPDGKIRWSAP